MGWMIRQYKDGKFALWSTISDSFIIRKTTRQKLIDSIIEDMEEKVIEKRIELEDNFPGGWIDKDTRKIIIKEIENDNK